MNEDNAQLKAVTAPEAMPELTAIRLTDYALANKVVLSCWDETSEDGAPHRAPDLINEYWIGIFANELIGCYRLHRANSATYFAHVLIIPEHRKQYALASGYCFLRWFLDNTEAQKLNCEIPAKYPNVMAFVQNFGLKHEGTNRANFTKDGILWDSEYYGITREEIEAFL